LDTKSAIVDRANLWDAWYNNSIKEGNMTKYQVHFEKTTNKGTKHGIRTINARNEAEAILKVKSVVQTSFGHWVNRLANEAV
jgi:hypothetical protein